jgi:trigger factor
VTYKVIKISKTAKKILFVIPFIEFSHLIDEIIGQPTKSKKGKRNTIQNIIKKRYNDIAKKLKKMFIELKVKELLKDLNLNPVAPPEISNLEIEYGKPLRFTIYVEYIPKFKLPKLKHILIKLFTPSVTPEMIRLAFYKFFKKFATFTKAPPDHNIDQNDRVIMSYLLRNTAGKVVERYKNSFDLFDLNVDPKLQEAIYNHKVGDSFSVDIILQQDHHSGLKKGEKLTYEIKIHDVFLITMPYIDDTAIKALNLQNVKTVEEFKTYLHDQIIASQQLMIDDISYKYIFNQLFLKSNLQVPQSLIELEIDKLITESYKTIQSKNQDKLNFSQQKRSKNQPLRSQFEQQAQFLVKKRIIFAKIADKYNISVSDEEINDYRENFPDGNVHADQNVDSYLLSWLMKDPDAIGLTDAAIKTRILTNKILAFLLSVVRKEIVGPYQGGPLNGNFL